MLISEIGIKGYKSFGNNEQVLKISTDSGKLILLAGNNGNGKSSIMESFEFTLYGKVKSNKAKKWHTLGTLPNRINGELLNRIKFKSGGVDIEVKRGISPSVLELWENGILNEKAGKSNVNEKIEKYVDMDIETFKSFISMSINDFKNFMSLTNEEKKLLLDKLFNLEIINILNDILKNIVKNNKNRISTLDSEISAFVDSIESIQRSIRKAIEREKQNIQDEINQIKNSMLDRKDEYKSLKDKLEKIKSKNAEIEREIDLEKDQLYKVKADIKNAEGEISLYKRGKCPTCSTDFNTTHFIDLKSSLESKLTGYKELLATIEDNVKNLNEKRSKLKSLSEKTQKSFNDINYLLKSYKSKILELESKRSKEDSDTLNVSEFQDSIKELEEKKTSNKALVDGCKEKELYYKELNRILSEDGVKKSIISGIIKPINHFLSENVKKMSLNFEVKLDQTFSAEVKSLGSVISHDSLSTGETKLVNICILIAYLKLIRTKKNINILFLDEVFSSIDLDNIDKILLLLKSFASECNINIFVVHHAILSEELFDRIINVDKNIFTTINEMSRIT